MALTLAHNPEEESWRKKGQTLYNIKEQEESEVWDVWQGSIFALTVKQMEFCKPRLSQVSQNVLKHSKPAKSESTTFCDLSPQLKPITFF